MSATALVVGGTGPTGPLIVGGLLERGYRVTILHRGTHESPLIPDEVEHLHGDPYDTEAIAPLVAGRRFDVAIATYGRLRSVASSLVGTAGHVVAAGGVPVYRGFFDPAVNHPWGFPVPVSETFPRAGERSEGERSWRVARAEREFFGHGEAGHFTASLVRYPYVYGPRQLIPREWSIIKRLLDDRRVFALPDGGLALNTHAYGANLAHAVLLAADQPDRSAGMAFNCGDEEQFTLRQWVGLIAAQLGVEVEVVSVPDVPGHPATAIANHQLAHHRLMDLRSIRDRLGYHDQVPSRDAISATVQHYLDEPPDPQLVGNLQDQFDYGREDDWIALAREFVRRAEDLAAGPVVQSHPYE